MVLVSWWLVNSILIGIFFNCFVNLKMIGDWCICINLPPLSLIKIQFASVSFKCMLFNRIHFQYLGCRCTLRHLWLQPKDPERDQQKGHRKEKERVQQQSRQNLFPFWCVFFIFWERWWNSTASTIACLTMSIIAVLSCSVHELVISLCIAFLFGTLRPVWVVFLVVVPVMMYWWCMLVSLVRRLLQR